MKAAVSDLNNVDIVDTGDRTETDSVCSVLSEADAQNVQNK